MQEVFFTILVIWILFRILGSSSEGANSRQETTRENSSASFQNRNASPHPTKKKISDDTGEYVDFEEIKD